MRYLILGAGAIGGTLGGHLHRAGREVALIARAAHAAAIRARGLRLVTGDADHRLPVPALASVAEAAPFGPEDVVLLTCKAQHTAAALGELRAAGAPPELPVVCCQNSIWNETHAQRVFATVYGAVVFVPGVYLQPGEVINARAGITATWRWGAIRPAPTRSAPRWRRIWQPPASPPRSTRP